jgi:hypothetical protein
MKEIIKFDFTGNPYLYKGRELQIKENEISYHFFEINKEGYPEFSKELDEEIIKWCIENGRLPRKIKKYLKNDNLNNENNNIDIYYTYNGKSKKLTSNIVVILKETDTRCKIQDLDGNITSVAKSQLTLKED